MAVTLLPYSQYNSGRVSDAEHEMLWSWVPDGLIPRQPVDEASALATTVNTSTRGWTVQPGRLLIAGHILDVTTAQTGTLAAGSSSARIDLIVGYVDRTTSPWTYGIGIRQGTPGAGRPALLASPTGRYEVALAQAQVTSTTATVTSDLRASVLQGPEAFGPGVPSAWASITTSVTRVNTLLIPARPFTRTLHVTAGCYIDPSNTTDTWNVSLYHGNTLAATSRNGSAAGVLTAALSSTALTVPAYSTQDLSIRVVRNFGTGFAATVADTTLNHIDVLAFPA